ncbi:MAG: RNA pseudouridine synthase [Rhodobacteraceae bacterium]|nr:RNA pseudouridine synthase [Paracoccaceae bacterium]
MASRRSRERLCLQPAADGPKVLHHDAEILVADKPAGLLSVPGRGPDRADCVIDRLRGAFPEVLLVHRLDLDTSGVMVFALTRAAQRHLGLQFERRHVRKAYLARVWGIVTAEAGAVDLPLAVDWPSRPRQKVDAAAGRPALTRWKVLKRAPGATRLRLFPETGRSHQLRVHMAAIGHPILGDPLYGTAESRAAAPRLHLHAETLRLRHPDGGRGVTFRSPCPF